MTDFLQQLIIGLRLGSVYALVALGYTMVYGIIRLINFAHGDFIMVGGYTLYFTVPILLHSMGLPAWTGVLAAIVICGSWALWSSWWPTGPCGARARACRRSSRRSP